jgi:hypothetical protein
MIGEVVETSASFEARFRATTLPDQLKADARSDDGREIGDAPDNSQAVFKSRRPRHMQWRYSHCVRLLREPDAANPHVRFDERGVETEARWS